MLRERLPTETAVVSDIIEAGRNLALASHGRVQHMAWLEGAQALPLSLSPADLRRAPWYLRFTVADEPGVLAQIAGALVARGISIAAVTQRERAVGTGAVPVVVVTHEAIELPVREAVAWLDGLSFSHGPTRLLPIDREPAGG